MLQWKGSVAPQYAQAAVFRPPLSDHDNPETFTLYPFLRTISFPQLWQYVLFGAEPRFPT
jgi:hypothetical protein